jgi:hypothetical protein
MRLQPFQPPTARDVLDIWRGPKPADVTAQSWARILDMRDKVNRGAAGEFGSAFDTAFEHIVVSVGDKESDEASDDGQDVGDRWDGLS